MEKVHKCDSRQWIAPQSVSVRQFIDEWVNAGIGAELNLDEQNIKSEARRQLAANLEPNVEEEDIISALVEECDENKLTVEGEKDFIYVNYDKTGDIDDLPDDLETLSLQKKHLKKYREDKSYRSAVHHFFKYKIQAIVENKSTKSRPSTKRVEESIKDVCAVLSCQFFRPLHSEVYFGENRRSPSLIADQEIVVLSSQYLTELRDVYCCVSDIATPGDCSNSPALPTTVTASDLYKSGFFFINNTFYNDLRSNSSIDYSQVIIDWAKEKGRGIGPFESKNMETTKFEDLEIRLGYPYVYVHQGNCEHLLVFTDLRLHVRQSDSKLLKEYPKFISTNKRLPIKCGACNLNTAKWITYGNSRLPEDPFFFCDICFRSFNYDEKSKKIGNFKAYPFLDRTAIL